MLGSTVNEVRLEHPSKAKLPMFVTVYGIVIDVRDEQLPNALPSIFVTEMGIFMEVKSEQPLFVAHIDNQRVACNTVEKS